MKFRTEIDIPEFEHKIEHHHPVICMGSCFARNIADYFKYYRFNILENPFGVLFNPISIVNAFRIIENRKKFKEDDLILYDNEWHSFYHHSDFSHHNRVECLERINTGIDKTYSFLRNARWLIITYGTAFIHVYKKTGKAVSNCHKIPAIEFEKQLLTVDETNKAVIETVDLVKKINPDLRIIFTISPVRHWKDGAVENQVSKSTLIISIHNCINELDNLIYFPSYELVMDDLRDYRFYNSDLLHPNRIATDYIWEKFSKSILNRECLIIMNEVEKTVLARNHKPRNINSDNHKKFVKGQLEQIEKIKKKYPHINMDEDENFFKDIKTDR